MKTTRLCSKHHIQAHETHQLMKCTPKCPFWVKSSQFHASHCVDRKTKNLVRFFFNQVDRICAQNGRSVTHGLLKTCFTGQLTIFNKELGRRPSWNVGDPETEKKV